MKKLLNLSLLFLFLTLPVYGGQVSDIYSEIPEILNKLPDNLTYGNISGYSSIAGEALMPENIFTHITDIFENNLSHFKSTLLSITVIIFLSSITEIFSSNLAGCGKITDYILLLCMVLTSYSLFVPLITSVSEYLNNFVSFMASASGTMTVLLSASGNVSAGTSSSVSAAFITAITQVFSVNIVLPASRTVMALSTISALSTDIDFSGVTNFLKNFCTWGLGVLFAIFGGVHSAAVAVTGAADNLAIRGIRFTAARLIPVAGNMISESMRTVISGINAIKVSAGGLGIVYILYSLLPAILPVLAVKLTILFGIFTSKLMGTKRHTAFLEGVNGSLSILMGICIFASVSGIVIFAVFMNTTTAL